MHDAASVVCPHIGLSADPKTRFSFPALAHRCYVDSRSVAISLGTRVTCVYRAGSRRAAATSRNPRSMAGPATMNFESMSPAEPAPASVAWGVRRSQVSQPPAHPKANEAPRPVVGVFPARDVTAAATLSAAHGGDPTPMARVVLEIMPTNLRTISPASPPPLAWKDETTVAVLTSILPPMAPVGRTASAGSSVDTTLDLSTSLPATARAKEELGPRSAFATGSPVADTRARLPARDPLRQLKTSGSPRPTSGSGPSTPRSDPTSAPNSGGGHCSCSWRSSWLSWGPPSSSRWATARLTAFYRRACTRPARVVLRGSRAVFGRRCGEPQVSPRPIKRIGH